MQACAWLGIKAGSSHWPSRGLGSSHCCRDATIFAAVVHCAVVSLLFCSCSCSSTSCFSIPVPPPPPPASLSAVVDVLLLVH